MQNLPVILAVILASAAIIAVLLWRLKTPPAVNTEAAEKRGAEETERARSLQVDLNTRTAALQEALIAASVAKATAEAADARAGLAETNASQAKADLASLQQKYQAAEPQIVAATERRKAAEDARADVTQRLADLEADYRTLQVSATQAAERATKAEKDAAAAKSEAEAVRQRAEASGIKLNETDAKLEIALIDLSAARSLAAETGAQREAAEADKDGLAQRHGILTQEHEALRSDYNDASERATTARADVEHMRPQIDGMSRTIEALELNLTEERAKLNQSLARQQSNEAAASHFKVISQEILDKTLEEAKRGVGELAASFQKSSGAELEKHADKITRTLEPLQAQLVAYDAAVESLKKGTQENYGSLREQLGELQKTERSLHDQAKALTAALSGGPKVKGAYGEMILKQLVEFVGMQEKCHFETQASRETEEGRKIPDLVVSLPGGQKVLVDAKAVMEACVEAYQTQDDAHRTILLKKHCDNVRSRVLDLSSKNYFESHKNAVEAVVLFLPAENLYATALENDSELTEYAMKRNIIICGPNSLMMLAEGRLPALAARIH